MPPTATVTDVATIACPTPSDAENLLQENNSLSNISGTESSVGCNITLINVNLLKNWTHRDSFISVVAILIIFALVVVVACITCRKAATFFCSTLRFSTTFYDGTWGRRHCVVLVHAWEDTEMVKTDLVNTLRDLGYMVAWNENVFQPGEDTGASIERAVSSSKRMLVVVSPNFMTYEHGKQIIRRGLDEESRIPGFKVLALVTDNLPKELPYSALYDIVVRRTPVNWSSCNYISKIRGFLPVTVSPHPSIWLTVTNLYSFFWTQFQIMERRESRGTSHRRDVQEIFPDMEAGGFSNPVSVSNSAPSNQEVARTESFNTAQPDQVCTRL